MKQVWSSKGAGELSALKGAELVHDDFNEAMSITDALEGVDRDKGKGHWLMEEAPQQVIPQLVAFINKSQ